jgi:hypothetical protein
VYEQAEREKRVLNLTIRGMVMHFITTASLEYMIHARSTQSNVAAFVSVKAAIIIFRDHFFFFFLEERGSVRCVCGQQRGERELSCMDGVEYLATRQMGGIIRLVTLLVVVECGQI